MAIRFEFKSNGQAISKQQRINPVLAGPTLLRTPSASWWKAFPAKPNKVNFACDATAAAISPYAQVVE
jgi:hypothetical protein